MKIQIFCQDCIKCQTLAKNVVVAAEVVNFDYELERVFELQKMTRFGPACCPAMFINGELRSLGRILSPEELERLFTFLLRSTV